MSVPVKTPKKLIEVALPLDSINTESLRRKQKAPKGWPSSFHKWWAQRPLAAARAVIFAQLVNDPSWKWDLEHRGEIPPNNLKASWAASRKRLFNLIEELILWDSSSNQEILEKARSEIRKSWRETCEINKDHPHALSLFSLENFPCLCDPFAGGGTIPLEAQRLGITAYASDLNPVAVLINKAMIEIPTKFAGRPPVNPEAQGKKQLVAQDWSGARGLAEDVRYYGRCMREEAQKRIGHLYPPVEVTAEMAKDRPDLNLYVGQKLTVTAWLWARTVKSPNPAFRHVDVPLASTFILSSKAGKEVYVEPVIEGDSYSFTVKVGKPPAGAKVGTKVGRGGHFQCLISGSPIHVNYIRDSGLAQTMGAKLIAIVAEGSRSRVYLSPTSAQEIIAGSAIPKWGPEVEINYNPRDIRTQLYGLTKYRELFTPRQLTAITTFSDILADVRRKVQNDSGSEGGNNDIIGIADDGKGAAAYADAICIYLACALDRMIYYGSSLTTWLPKDNALRDCMPRQALAMTWDFAEGNPLAKSSGDIITCTASVANYLDVATPFTKAFVTQCDARSAGDNQTALIFSTDPPYYDNIGYADLSDYFYVWLRSSLRPILPDLFATVTTPKTEELVATPYRHGSKDKAEVFFLDGMTEVMHRLVERAHPAFPVTIYYAFKQAESESEAGVSSTGWETFLEAVIRSGFAITGTWPMRTEGAGRMVAKETNALASSIVLVCRPRPTDAQLISRRAFLRELNHVLPEALDKMTSGTGDEHSPVAPVDLSQAIIGPGMEVFSKYAAVLEADGTPMSVRTALQIINRFFAEDDFDHDTQFCLHWFGQYGWKEGKFGEADTLSRSKGTSVEGVRQSGVLYATGGVVRLIKWPEYPADWDPQKDDRLPVWELLHQLIRVFKANGERAAGLVVAAVPSKAEATRQLAYRLYTLCERSGWAEDARAYNEIITSWSAIEAAAAAAPTPLQADMFD
jgi:putative DNA methylase